jgi:hypothetical protein
LILTPAWCLLQATHSTSQALLNWHLQIPVHILTPPRTLKTVVNFALLLIAPMIALEMARSLPRNDVLKFCCDRFNLCNRHCSVISFATYRCANMMEVTVFAISIPAPPTFEETVFAMSDAQVLGATTTLEIVAMQANARLTCEIILNAIACATTRHAVTMVENARFRVLPQVPRSKLHQSSKASLVLPENDPFPSSEQRNLLF